MEAGVRACRWPVEVTQLALYRRGSRVPAWHRCSRHILYRNWGFLDTILERSNMVWLCGNAD
eukprot:2425693-Lingulodinium_polyedra.AAC.1